MDLLTSVVTGVVASLVASGVFLFFLTRLRPKVEISPVISKSLDTDNNPVYSVKIVNKSRRSLINIKAQLQLVGPAIVPGGMIEGVKEVPLYGDNPLEILGFKSSDKTEKYAYRFTILEDLEKALLYEQQTYLRIIIFATDSVSGFSRAFSQEYQTKRNSFKEGDFVLGREMDIK
jgi:hypothetical protein